MHCQRINELNLLSVDENTNVLKRFPLNVKRKIIKEISDSLILSSKAFSEGSNILSSWGHVLWNLEVLGQAFSLPFEDHQLILNCASLYQKWLFSSGNDIPEAILNIKGTDFEQQLWIKTASHFSLAFEPRYPIEEDATSANQLKIQGLHLLNAHLEICQNILKMLTTMVRMNATRFTQETWEVLIKIHLGLADTLLREPCLKKDINRIFSSQSSIEEIKADIASYMGDRLAEPLFRLCIESFLRAATFSAELWSHLKMRILTWNHRKCIISDWMSYMLGLNTHFTDYLFNLSNRSQSNLNVSSEFQGLGTLSECHITMYIIAL